MLLLFPPDLSQTIAQFSYIITHIQHRCSICWRGKNVKFSKEQNRLFLTQHSRSWQNTFCYILINIKPVAETRPRQSPWGVGWAPWGQDGLQTYRILKFVVGSFGLDFILLTTGSIQAWNNITNTYGAPWLLSNGGRNQWPMSCEEIIFHNLHNLQISTLLSHQ